MVVLSGWHCRFTLWSQNHEKTAHYVDSWLTFALGNVWGGTDLLISCHKTLTTLQGDWVLSPMDQQEGGATKTEAAAKLIGTDGTAMSFKVIGKGSAVQENLLPGP